MKRQKSVGKSVKKNTSGNKHLPAPWGFNKKENYIFSKKTGEVVLEVICDPKNPADLAHIDLIVSAVNANGNLSV